MAGAPEISSPCQLVNVTLDTDTPNGVCRLGCRVRIHAVHSEHRCITAQYRQRDTLTAKGSDNTLQIAVLPKYYRLAVDHARGHIAKRMSPVTLGPMAER